MIWIWFVFETMRKVIMVHFPRSSFAVTLSAPLLDKFKAGGGSNGAGLGPSATCDPMVNQDEEQRSTDYNPQNGVQPGEHRRVV